MDAVRIPLRSGGFALIDPIDEPKISAWRWSWREGSRGYAESRRCIGNGRQQPVRLHRLILDFPDSIIDHANGNRLDNRRCNLRVCTNSQNQANRAAMPHCSRFKGVTIEARTGKFCSQIWCNGKRYWLGTFTNETQAARAYDRAALKHFGEFARLNFPQDERVAS